jgi:hypothetical protein
MQKMYEYALSGELHVHVGQSRSYMLGFSRLAHSTHPSRHTCSVFAFYILLAGNVQKKNAAYMTAGKTNRRDLALSTVHRYATKSSRRAVPNAVCKSVLIEKLGHVHDNKTRSVP